MSQLTVAADLRWPAGTGIGICQHEYISRAPQDISVRGLNLKGSVANPASPFTLGAKLRSDRSGAQVFWNPGFVPPLGSPVPSVVTVHDLTHLHFYSSLHARYYDWFFKPMYRRCAAVICVSEYTRGEFLEWSGMDPGRVHVVYNGVSNDFHPSVKPYGLDYPYILYPGNKRGYKNLAMLLRAFACSSLPKLGVKVVMTGTATQELQEAIDELGIAKQVVFLGFVPAAGLPGLYRGAMFTAFISLYEGFGLPIIESMAVGTPVLTSNVSSMPEIAADAALIASPHDLDEIVQGMDALVTNESLRARMVVNGLLRAARFSWAEAAGSTWSIVRSAAQKL